MYRFNLTNGLAVHFNNRRERYSMKEFQDYIKTLTDLSVPIRGGQKEVYFAKHPAYGPVALKLSFQLDDPRVQREIEISRDYHFEAVPKIFEVCHMMYNGCETLCIIEEKIEGQTLDRFIQSGQRFTLSEAVNLLEQGLAFITELEGKQIVHRDIKPQNIIMTAEKKVYFLDFGIARMLDASSLTATGALLGPHSPGYAAPEQFNNLKASIDSRADIFSLGVVTYECLSGHNPFREGATSHLDILQKTETITPVVFQIPGDSEQQLMGLLSAMMGKYPSRRPRNATQALNWLNAAKATFGKEV